MQVEPPNNSTTGTPPAQSPDRTNDGTTRGLEVEHMDVLVVGAGPAGSITALELARRGHRVVAIDQRPSEDRRQRSGSILTPRALYGLDKHQISIGTMSTTHRVARVRVTHDTNPRRSVSMPWPSDVSAPGGGVYPDYGLVVDRRELDLTIARTAAEAGAEVRYGLQAVVPIVDRGFVRGAQVSAVEIEPGTIEPGTIEPGQIEPGNQTHGTQVHDGRSDRRRRAIPAGTAGDSNSLAASYTVVADGANSRFGRSLGTFRNPLWPYALGHRGRYRSDLSTSDEVEFVVGLTDRSGDPIAGHAWLVPCGDGTVVVGVMVNSNSPSFRVITPDRLLERVTATHRQRWRLDPDPTTPTTGSRLPLGMSVEPVAGPTFVLVGDAAGAANPITGAGIEYAVETGGLAAEVLDRALTRGISSELQNYSSLIQKRYGQYFKLGRLSTRAFRSPTLATRAATFISGDHWANSPVLRFATNELREGGNGLAEMLVRGAQLIDPLLPSA